MITGEACTVDPCSSRNVSITLFKFMKFLLGFLTKLADHLKAATKALSDTVSAAVYRRRRLQRMLSPSRNDAFAMGDKTPDSSVRTYADVMRDQQLARERDNTMQNIADKLRKEEEERELDARPTKASGVQLPPPPAQLPPPAAKSAAAGEKRRNRWDQSNGNVDTCGTFLFSDRPVWLVFSRAL